MAWIAAGVAGIAAGWGVIRGALHWISTAVVGHLQDDTSNYMNRALQYFLWYRCRRLPLGGRAIETRVTPLRDGTLSQVLFEAIPPHPILFFWGWVPLIVSKSEVKNGDGGVISILYLRGTLDPVKFFRLVHEQYHEYSQQNRFEVIRTGGDSSSSPIYRGVRSRDSDRNLRSQIYQPVLSHQHDLIGQSVNSCRLEDLSLSDELHHAVQEVREWFRSRAWYVSRGIPWRRGWLLHGPPGTGKSTLAKALAADLDIPIYRFDLATMDNSDFTDEWSAATANTPCIVLLEDIDAVFDGRENRVKTMNGGLTFDCLLNAISGVGSGDGVFTILTSNDISKVDPAIAQVQESGTTTRPGRVDRVLFMGTPGEAGLLKIARRVLPDVPDAQLRELVQVGKLDTVAQFTERCVSLALSTRWSGPWVPRG